MPVTTLLSGSSVAFLIGYLAKPVLLRLFPVAAFGVYDFVVTLVAIVLPVASLRYEDAIMLPETDEEARDIFALSSLLTACVVGLTGLAVFLFGDTVTNPEARRWLWSVPILLLILRASKLSELWLTRQKLFSVISSGNAGQSAVNTATKIGAGLQGAGAGGLLLGFGLGHLMAALIYGWRAMKSLPAAAGTKLAASAQRYRRFPQFSAPAALISALATRLPFLLLMVLFGAEVLGWFGQAFNILYIPLSLVGTAIGQVFFVRAAEAQRSGNLASETHDAHRWLILAVLVPMAGIAAVAPDVFSFLFGAEWRTAGEYAILIAPWIALSAIASPLTRVFDVLELQKRDLGVNLFSFLLLVGALFAGSRFPDPATTIMLLGAAGAVARGSQVLVALQAAKIPLVQTATLYIRPVLEAGLVYIVLRLGTSSLSPAGITLLLAATMLIWAIITVFRLRALTAITDTDQ